MDPNELYLPGLKPLCSPLPYWTWADHFTHFQGLKCGRSDAVLVPGVSPSVEVIHRCMKTFVPEVPPKYYYLLEELLERKFLKPNGERKAQVSQHPKWSQSSRCSWQAAIPISEPSEMFHTKIHLPLHWLQPQAASHAAIELSNGTQSIHRLMRDKRIMLVLN